MAEIINFNEKEIRKIWHNDEWYFSVVDIVGVLTESSIPRRYWTDLKKKLNEEGFEMYENLVQLKLEASDAKLRMTDCVNNKGAFRLIQSIPSKKAEPLKLWLAQLGQDRMDEIQNPELGIQRNLDYYRRKGHSDEWIKRRKLSITTRKKLTEEWKNRGIQKNLDFAILTNIIHKGTFDFSVKNHKEFKLISKKDELRDHMNDIELALISLSEATTTEITKQNNSQGLEELSDDADSGASVGRNARIEIEGKIGKKVVSKENFLNSKDEELK